MKISRKQIRDAMDNRSEPTTAREKAMEVIIRIITSDDKAMNKFIPIYQEGDDELPDLEVKVTIGGVVFSPQKFLAEIADSFDAIVGREAKKECAKVSGLTELKEKASKLDDLLYSINNQIEALDDAVETTIHEMYNTRNKG